MKNTLTLLCVFIFGLYSVLNAQTALDPNQFVNTQITEAGVYTVEAGQSYAFDGRIDLTFEVTIIGPDNGWIMKDATPPVLVNTPAADGAPRNFFELKEGGALTLKNVLVSGKHNNDELVKIFAVNTGGSKMIVDNCVFADWQDFALRNQNKGDSISVTNSVFINGVRLRYSQWGGFPLRMDVACDNVLWENNTVVNSGRLLANSGPFNNANVHQLHNTYINQGVAGEEQRANEFLIANNIFYNFHFLGIKTENHSSPDNTYGSYFTTWNYFADSKESLDSVSLYFGQNLFYREPAIEDWFDASGGDSLAVSLLWEHADVDSFITADNNYTIGTNYAEMEPGFTMHPGNTEAIVNHINGYRLNPTADWVDWRIPSPVTFNEDGTPALNWPPAFDLSYSNSDLQTAGTDGLPLGDLNWFPDKKAEYLTNKDAIVGALRDSMVNAVAVYDPTTMDNTPMITDFSPAPTAPTAPIIPLDPNQFVNAQITGPGIYTVEAGQSYAFDGRIDLNYDITIIGPYNGWIVKVPNPPILVNTPAADGSARDFFELKEGGALTLKNVLLSGKHNNDELVGIFAANTGGSKMIVDNCAFSDWQNFALRNQNKGDSISVTNSVFINGVRLRYSQWGGFPLRMDVACDNVIWENNTVVNSGRFLANSGPFNNANVHQLHNTYVNQGVAGEEQRANEFLIANNIFYNFHFLGIKTENHSSPDNTYGSYFTTWNYFADSKESLDSVSLYFGQNLFYREPALENWFDESGGDSLAVSLLWEHADVDSFITADNNYTIGTNYAEMEPGFTMHPGNTEAIVNHINGYRLNPTADWVDWRIASPVNFGEDGLPVLSWPPAFDLSYSNDFLRKAGTDGLPLGDLNWFPDKKEEYLANKAAILASLRDSIDNAVAVYDPTTMDNTPMITGVTTSVEQVDPSKLFLLGNYPNPFKQNTTIQFSLHQQADVTISVSNLMGQQVLESTQNGLLSGTHEVNFNALNLSGGVYIYKIKAIGSNGKTYVGSKKMILY